MSKRRIGSRFALVVAALCCLSAAGCTGPDLPAQTSRLSPDPARTLAPLPTVVTPAPTAPNEPDPQPPAAQLLLIDGTVHPGTVGSYHFGGVAADAPWLPARSLPEAVMELGSVFELSAPPLGFVRWGARFADAADESGDIIHPLDSGGDGQTAEHEAIITTPPSGAWVLHVQLYFAEDAGEANYYWYLLVP